jgi:hypothetical protein
MASLLRRQVSNADVGQSPQGGPGRGALILILHDHTHLTLYLTSCHDSVEVQSSVQEAIRPTPTKGSAEPLRLQYVSA